MAKTTRPGPKTDDAVAVAEVPGPVAAPGSVAETRPDPMSAPGPGDEPVVASDPVPGADPLPATDAVGTNPASTDPTATDPTGPDPDGRPGSADFIVPPAVEPDPEPVSVAHDAEPASAEPPPPQRPPAPPAETRRSSGFGGMVLGGVIAAALGYGVATYAPVLGLTGPTDQTALTDRVGQAEAAVATLGDRVSALENAPEPVADNALADRVQALEDTTTTGPQADLGPLTGAIDRLEARLATLETGPPAQRDPATPGLGDSVEGLRAEVDALRAEVDALKGSGETVSAEIAAAAADANARLAEAEAQAAQLTAEAEEISRRATTRAAISRLQASLESGAPFGMVLETLSDMEIPPVLLAAAETGIPSQAALEDAFPPAARAALEASRQADMGASWTDRLGTFVQSTTGVRSLTPRAGTDPDAVLSRAEAAVNLGDLDAALAELAGLPAEGQAEMAGFIALAQTRIDAAAAVATLSAANEE